jgi:hypothetical protein
VTTTHLGRSDPERVAKLRGQGDTVTSVAIGADDARTLPDYAPIPRSALGPALNDQGYHVGGLERNLYWVTDGAYQSAFLITDDGVVLFESNRREILRGHRHLDLTDPQPL